MIIFIQRFWINLTDTNQINIALLKFSKQTSDDEREKKEILREREVEIYKQIERYKERERSKIKERERERERKRERLP